MPGGRWFQQNKVLPGVYVNINEEELIITNQSEVATKITIARAMSWGPQDVFYAITANTSVFKLFAGTDTSFLNDFNLTGGSVINLYAVPVAGGTAASAVIDDGNNELTVTAKYVGVGGNNLFIKVVAAISGGYVVSTSSASNILDSQTVTSIQELKPNDYVTFSGTGPVPLTQQTFLTGGLDGTVDGNSFTAFLNKISDVNSDFIVYDGSIAPDQATAVTQKRVLVDAVETLATDRGIWTLAVMANAPDDIFSQHVVSLVSGYKTKDKEYTADDATRPYTAKLAAQVLGSSSVYSSLPGAVSCVPEYTIAQLEAQIALGRVPLFSEFGTVKIASDYTTLYGNTQDSRRSSISIVRSLFFVANQAYERISVDYIGKVRNNENGRELIRVCINNILAELAAAGAIQPYEPSDVSVVQGEQPEGVVCVIAIRPYSVIEKVYVTVAVGGLLATTEE